MIDVELSEYNSLENQFALIEDESEFLKKELSEGFIDFQEATEMMPRVVI